MSETRPDVQGAAPTDLTCPVCHGVLRTVPDLPIPTYRCRTGHQFTVDSLLLTLEQDIEDTLWTALRVLEEGVEAERKYADILTTRNEQERAREAVRLADRHARQIKSVRAAIDEE